jgi:glycosyltransferase involved in cell wall biosynthesis
MRLMMARRTVAYDHQIFALQEYGGISRYICEIAEHIACEDMGVRVIAPMHFNRHLARSAVPRWGLHLQMHHPRISRFYRAVNAALSGPLITAAAPDLLHRTYYNAAPRSQCSRHVLTVHDMIHELYPQHFAQGDRTSSHKRRSVAEADHVICVSHSTARDLQRLFNVPAEKITVIHLGFSSSIMAPAYAPVRVRPYFLYVGHRAGYKNFARMLNAYGRSSRLREAFDLVVFGGTPWTAEEQANLSRLSLRDGSVRREVGDDAALARAYAGAFALVYPSEYEGFGIPPLEAMSCGCPVACSDSSSIPEVVGEAAILFDATRVESIRSAMEDLADDACRRAALIEAGRAQQQRFSWKRCARETLAVYRRLLGESTTV